MLNLNRTGIPRIIGNIALAIVFLGFVNIFYIVIFKGLWKIIYALIFVESLGVRLRILSTVANDLSFSMFIPYSVTLLLTSLPQLKPYADILKLRNIGFIVVVFLFIGGSLHLLHGKEVALLITLIVLVVSAVLFLSLLTKNWHANTLLSLGTLFILFSILNMIGIGVFVLSPRISLTYLLLLVYGLLNITVGYVNLRGITPRVEKLLKVEIVFLALLGLYRLYATGGKL